MTLAPSRWLGLIAVAVLSFGCSSSGSTATATPGGGTGQNSSAAQTAAPAQTAATAEATEAPGATDAGGGSSGDVIQRDIPKIVEGGWSKGTAHVEITGGRSLTFDAPGGAIGVGGTAILTFINSTASRSFQASVSGTEQSGFAITAGTLVTGGTWGKECQLKITRNETAAFAGDFSCSNAEAADTSSNQAFTVNVRGSFSATP